MSIEKIEDHEGNSVLMVQLLDGTFVLIDERGIPSEQFNTREEAERVADEMLTRARGLAALKKPTE